MTTGAIIVFVVAIIAVGLFGIYAANHVENDNQRNSRLKSKRLNKRNHS